jgi:hypothetical protein
MDRFCRRLTLVAQEEALRGFMGSILRTISMVDGQTQAEYKLTSTPLHDGMSTTNGKLFIALADGRIVFMGSSEESEHFGLRHG